MSENDTYFFMELSHIKILEKKNLEIHQNLHIIKTIFILNCITFYENSRYYSYVSLMLFQCGDKKLFNSYSNSYTFILKLGFVRFQ
jgi:hypothetical protein